MEKGPESLAEKREEHSTRLEEVITAFGLKPASIVRTADRIARERGVASISRAHLLRLRKRMMAATEEKIFILVMALRQMTGVMLRPSDLFVLEPSPAGPSLPSGGYGEAVLPPVSSPGSRIAYLWRVLVAEDPTQSSDQAFEALYAEHGALLRGIAVHRFSIPFDDAEALVHDCFVSYLERHTTVRDAKAWLCGAMRNTCIDYLRARRREAPLLPEHDETADPAARSSVDSWMWKLTFASILARLNVKCRETLRSHYLSDEPKQALADRLTTTPGYIDQLLSICRRRLHELGQTLGIFHK